MPVNMKKAKISKLKEGKKDWWTKPMPKEISLQMIQKFVWTTNVQKLTEANLRNDSAKFATGGRDTISGWTISGWENFSRNDEGRDIGTKVLEEIGETVEEYKSLGIACSASKLIESEAWTRH